MIPNQKYNEAAGKNDGVYDVAVVGAGPVGLTLSIALAKLGVNTVLLDAGVQLKQGSRAICFAKRSLEIFDKLGVAGPMMALGVQWNTGRIYYKDREIDRFDLMPSKHSKYPAFINIQQYYIEEFLAEAAAKEKNLAVRWRNKVFGIRQEQDGVRLNVTAPEGEYALNAQFVIGCDGSKSAVRQLMGLQLVGERIEERFLIADFKMEADFPAERRFWFDPPFAPGQNILLHKQPDNLWRFDFKLGRDTGGALAEDTGFIRDKIRNVAGNRPFELAWTSIYSFSNKMLEKFIHGRVIFAGDAAHVLSPFGARGANSGIEDANNLAWKLAHVLKNPSATKLLDTYNAERTAAARQNILIAGHSATFIAPPTPEGLRARNQILAKAVNQTLAKKQINCGRLSAPAVYGRYPGSENGSWKNMALQPGRVVMDCFFNDRNAYLIEHLDYQFAIICQKDTINERGKVNLTGLGCKVLEIDTAASPELSEMYELTKTSAYLVSPDQYILGRWKRFTVRQAAGLINRYLSGECFLSGDTARSEQELLDEQVCQMIKNATA